MLSAGNPVPGATIATVEAQVSRAQRSMVARSTPPLWNDTGMAGAGAVGPGATAGAAWALDARAVARVTAATAAPPARRWRRVATNRVGVTTVSFMRFPCLAMVFLMWVHVMPVVAILSMNRRWKMRQTVCGCAGGAQGRVTDGSPAAVAAGDRPGRNLRFTAGAATPWPRRGWPPLQAA